MTTPSIGEQTVRCRNWTLNPLVLQFLDRKCLFDLQQSRPLLATSFSAVARSISSTLACPLGRNDSSRPRRSVFRRSSAMAVCSCPLAALLVSAIFREASSTSLIQTC